ncbi:dTDP-3-amino-3,6-dideoxy-alpha-D-galactopyranose 3-N-acetyltransferase [Vibrio vulnificus]|nr:dTDP-3-amino-3,6-dideoxy-alpha-D-galactopyranose 3-N-acetyltransferase [Vibrio vulnificus]OJI56086.1 dTDP-3-amino-3,6-dideoxy-alpha-D-galactopyranose 3-N-acetyltransferase [Vibrio fluvialis]
MINVDELIKQGLLIVGDNVTIQPGVILGVLEDDEPTCTKPEKIYIGSNTIIRSGAVIYQGVEIGENCKIGHGCIIRKNVKMGDHVCLSHYVTVEYNSKLGNWVRISPHTHVTSSCVLEDRVFLGAGVATVNSKYLDWKKAETEHLEPPYFSYGARVGSGSTVLSNVKIGKLATVGAGSTVTKDIPEKTIYVSDAAKFLKVQRNEQLKANGK